MTKSKTPPVSNVQKHSYPWQAILGKWLRRTLAVGVLGASLALSSSSHAEYKYWSGAAGNNWDYTTANWTGASSNFFASGDAAIFQDTNDGTILVDAGGITAYTITFNNNDNVDYTFEGGIIEATGAVYKYGANTVTFNSANNFHGGSGVEILGGTIKAGVSGALGTSNILFRPDASQERTLVLGNNVDLFNYVQMLGDGYVSVENSDSAALSRGMGDSATLTKIGTGTLTLTGLVTFNGTLAVNAGTLKLGATMDGKITVNNGGTFESISGAALTGNVDVNSGGNYTAAPNFKVAGNLGFKAGSFAYIDLGKTEAESTKIEATDGIDFSGNGTVTVVVANNGIAVGESSYDGAVVQAGATEGITLGGSALTSGTTNGSADKTNIQITQGGTTIQFQGATGNSTGLEFNTATTTGNTIALNAIGSDGPGPVPVGYTANELAIRDSIEPAAFGTFANSLMGYLETLQTDAEKKLFLDKLNPILSTAMAMNSQFSVNRFAGSMNREMNRRDPARGCSPCDAVGCGQSSRLNSWYEGFGEYLHQDTVNDIRGYKTNNHGFSLGFDKNMTNRLTLGVGFGGSFGNFRTEDRLERGESDNYMVALYGAYKRSDWQLSFNGGYMYSDYDLNRYFATGSEISSSHDGDSYFGGFDLSKRFKTRFGNLSPFIAFEMVSVKQDGYRERLNNVVISEIMENTTDAYLQTIGVRWSSDRKWGRWIVNRNASLGWVHDYGQGHVYMTGRYAGGNNFYVAGPSRVKDRALLNVGLDAKLNNRFALFGGYTGEFGEHFDAQSFELGLRYGF